MSLCYLDGAFLPLADARVSVLDRGFLFGDGVYEVIPVFDRRAFRLAHHLARLERSLAAAGVANPLSRTAWAGILEHLIGAHDGRDFSAYAQVTRGVAPRCHEPPVGIRPTVFVMLNPLQTFAPTVTVTAVTHPDIRWQCCEIKTTSLIANVLLRQAAIAAQATEAILIRDGFVTEGAASNVFAVIAGRLRTPAHSEHILPGVTRDLLVELLADTRDAVDESAIALDDLRRAEEIFLTSSGRQLAAVSRLDGEPVGAACPGPVFMRVYARYAEFKATGAAR